MDTDAFHSLPGGTIIDRFGYRECAPKKMSSTGPLAPAQPTRPATTLRVVRDMWDGLEVTPV